MHTRKVAALGILAAVLPLALGGCATTGINRGQMNIISTDEEVKLGQEMSVEVAKQYPIYNNAAVTAYAQAVGDRIVQTSDRKDIALRSVEDGDLSCAGRLLRNARGSRAPAPLGQQSRCPESTLTNNNIERKLLSDTHQTLPCATSIGDRGRRPFPQGGSHETHELVGSGDFLADYRDVERTDRDGLDCSRTYSHERNERTGSKRRCTGRTPGTGVPLFYRGHSWSEPRPGARHLFELQPVL